MFKFIKSIFAPENQTVSKEQLILTEALPARFANEFQSVDGTATIRQMKNGKFRLLVNENEVVATYSRKADAIRGANRRGLSVVG